MRGLGAILMLNHVRPWEERRFAPNRALEITPEYLDRCLTLARSRGYEFIALDDVPERLRETEDRQPFIAIAIDGGYRDLPEFALPVFRRHRVPFTSFVTTGFAQGLSPLWWVDLELAIETLSAIAIEADGFRFHASCGSNAEKERAHRRLMRALRKTDEPHRRKIATELASAAGIDSLRIVKRLCMSFDDIAMLAQEPLASIGAQTLTYPILLQHDYRFARYEIGKSRQVIEEGIHRPVNHFAYPFGDRRAAGMRDFYLAASAGFETAVTKRPGLLFREHAEYLYALPRLQLNGHFQTEGAFDALLSGLPFALWNRGRTLNVT